MIWRIGGALVLLVLALAIAQRLFFHAPAAPQPAVTRAIETAAAPPGPPPAGCQTAPAFAAASGANAATSTNAPWSVFGRPENGWQIYVPWIAHDLGVACPPDFAGLRGGAGGLAARAWAWPRAAQWTRRRCAPSTSPGWRAGRSWLRAATASAPARRRRPAWSRSRPPKAISASRSRLRPGTLAAYRRMVAAARAEEPGDRRRSEAADHLLRLPRSGRRRRRLRRQA